MKEFSNSTVVQKVSCHGTKEVAKIKTESLLYNVEYRKILLVLILRVLGEARQNRKQ